MKTDLLSFGLLACSVGVIIFTFMQQQRQNQESIEMKDEIIKQKETIIQEMKDAITGGDSYLFVRPQKVANSEEVIFLFEFRGRHTIYDVTVTVDEYNLKIIDSKTMTYEKVNRHTTNIGTVHPLKTNDPFKIDVPVLGGYDQFGKRFFFSIRARNGLVEEDVFIRREGTHFSHAYKVVQMFPSFEPSQKASGIAKVFKKIRHIDPAFPVHELSHLQGDSGWLGTFEESTGTTVQLKEPEAEL